MNKRRGKRERERGRDKERERKRERERERNLNELWTEVSKQENFLEAREARGRILSIPNNIQRII